MSQEGLVGIGRALNAEVAPIKVGVDRLDLCLECGVGDAPGVVGDAVNVAGVPALPLTTAAPEADSLAVAAEPGRSGLGTGTAAVFEAGRALAVLCRRGSLGWALGDGWPILLGSGLRSSGAEETSETEAEAGSLQDGASAGPWTAIGLVAAHASIRVG